MMRALLPALASSAVLAFVIPPGARAQQAPRLSLTEELRIGSVDTEPYMLTRVTSLSVAPDGSVYVVQPDESMVRVFDGAGRFVRSIGRRGQGPGEFEAPLGIGWVSDTLWVRDAATNRISFFSRDGRYLRGGVHRVPAPAPAYIATAPRALLADGGALVAFNWSAGNEPPTHTLLARVDSGGAVIDTLARDPMIRAAHAIVTATSRGGGPQTYGDAALAAVIPGGRQIVLLDRTAASRGGTATFRLTRVDVATGKRTTSTHAYAPVALRRQSIDSSLQRQIELHFKSDFGPKVYGTPAAALEMMKKGVYAPAFLPPVSEMIAGADGTVWLQRWKSSTWMAIDPAGRMRGEITLPPRTTLQAANGDLIWAVQLDADDVPFVVRYRVRPTG